MLRLENALTRLERERGHLMTDQRKADTRHKIQLGGLIIKAGLGHVDAMALLGLLVTHRDAARDPGEQQHLREVGRAFATQARGSDDGA